MKKILSLLSVIALITSCAVVPKESVELSATVGR
ncbi:lipoprotein, partial [Lutibacter sp.]